MKIPPFALERFFAAHEFSTPHLLCASDCEALSVDDLLSLEAGAEAAFRDLWLGYTESLGHPDLRAEIAGLYDSVDAAQVLVHSGAEEAIFGFMNAAIEPGGHVIVQTPCYQSLTDLPRALGFALSEWPAREDFGWALSLDELERLIRPDTRALIVNLPHNPTGFLAPHAVFERMVEICRANGLLLFCDEVYRLLEFDPAERLPAACDAYENGVSLGVMSKSFGLAGLRIGWIATRNRSVLDAMAGFKDYTTICNSAPSEFLATVALRHRDAVVGRNLRIIEGNLALLDGFFERQSEKVTWQRPRAGSIALPRFADGLDGVALCRAAIDIAGVLLAPGSTFGAGDNHFRIGFGRADMPQALARLEEYLESSA